MPLSLGKMNVMQQFSSLITCALCLCVRQRHLLVCTLDDLVTIWIFPMFFFRFLGPIVSPAVTLHTHRCFTLAATPMPSSFLAAGAGDGMSRLSQRVSLSLSVQYTNWHFPTCTFFCVSFVPFLCVQRILYPPLLCLRDLGLGLKLFCCRPVKPIETLLCCQDFTKTWRDLTWLTCQCSNDVCLEKQV